MAKDQKIEKANNFSGTLKRIIKLMFTQYKVSSILIVFFALASTVFGIVGPKIMGQATTELFEGLVAKISNEGSINFEKIAGILLTVLGLYILSSLFMFIQGWLMSNVSQKMTYDIRKDISKKINTLPVGYFEQRTVGETLSRVTNDVDTLGQSLNQSFTQIISNTAMVLGVLVMMFTISPLMTLIALALIPISGILLGAITKWSQKYFKSQQDMLSDVNGQVEESFSGQNIIAAFNYKEKSVKEFNDKNKQLYTSSWKANFFSGLMFPVINFVGNLGYVGIVFSGGLLVSKGAIGVGDIQAFIQYIRNFTQPIGQIAQSMSEIQKMAAAGERVFEFLDAKDEQDAEVLETVTSKEGNVVFDKVKFGYVEDQIIIKNFTSDVKKGEMVAIVGPTGAGKTTMMKMINQLIEPTDGNIYLNDKRIKDHDQRELRLETGYVLQQIALFPNLTVAENIALIPEMKGWKKEQIQEQTKVLLEKVGLSFEDYAHRYPKELSGGEQQRVGIVRAIIATPKILLMDEPFSALDAISRKQLQDLTKQLHQEFKMTTLFVTHDTDEAVKLADRIAVLKDGEIVQVDTPYEIQTNPANAFVKELFKGGEHHE